MSAEVVSEVFFDPNWFAQATNDALIALDSSFRFLYVNPKAEHLFGQNSSTLIGQKAFSADDIRADTGKSFLSEQFQIATSNPSSSWNTYYPSLKQWFEVRVVRLSDAILFFLHELSQTTPPIEENTATQECELDDDPIKIGLWDYDYGTGIIQEWMPTGKPPLVEPRLAIPFTENIEKWQSQNVDMVSNISLPGVSLEDTGGEYHMRESGGSHHWVLSRGMLVRDEHKQPKRFIGVSLDAPEQNRQVESAVSTSEAMGVLAGQFTSKLSYGRFNSVSADSTPMGIWEYEFASGSLRWSDSAFPIFGLPIGEHPSIEEVFSRIHPDDVSRVRAEVADAIRDKSNCSFNYRVIWDDGSIHHIRCLGSPIFDSSGVAISLRGSMIDVSQSNSVEERVKWLAYHDPLTYLPNRLQFREKIEEAIEVAGENSQEIGLLFLDLDGFKHVNDTFGHERGDKLLQIVANRLRNAVRSDAIVARMGGDEFTVLLPILKSQREPEEIALRLLRVMSDTIALDGNEVVVTTSIGIGIYPYDGRDIETLVRHADRAMYEAKGKGGNTFQTHSIEANVAAFNRLLLENSLRRAVKNRDLHLLYQPQLRLSTGKIEAVEALLRWNHAEIGDVPRQHFIPLAEETGLIKTIGEWVIREACQQAILWRDSAEGTIPLRLAINLSARQLSHPGLVETVEQALIATGLPASSLELELTESAIIWNGIHAVDTLRQLRSLGVRLSVDDFGTGYSSLSYLRRFPLDSVKIDQSFVSEIIEDPQTLAIVKAVIDLSHALHLNVIAEGVETEAQRQCLADLGCDLIQGYLVCAPVTAENIRQFYYNFARFGLQAPPVPEQQGISGIAKAVSHPL